MHKFSQILLFFLLGLTKKSGIWGHVKSGKLKVMVSAMPTKKYGRMISNAIKFVSLRTSDRVTGVAISVYNAIL